MAQPVKLRRKGRFRLKKTTILILCLLLVLFLWPVARKLGRYFVKTQRSYFGQVECSYRAEGVFIRREQLLLSPIAGRVELLVDSGTRVPRGAQLVRVVNEDLKKRLQPQLEGAEEALAAHGQTAKETLDRLEERVKKWQLAIDNHTVKLKNQLERRNYVAARQLEEELADYTGKRRGATDELAAKEDEFAKERAQLEERLSQVKKQLARAEEVICAKEPGIISFQLDGLEEESQKKRFGVLFGKSFVPKATTVKDAQTVAIGEPLGRLIDNYQCQLALAFQSKERFTKGQAIFLHLPTGLELGKVESWSQNGDLTYLLCTMENYKLGWNDLRQLELELATKRKSGVIVPKRAITTHEGKRGVYVREGRRFLFREVEVQLIAQDKAVVVGLPSGEAVVVNPRFLKK